MNSSRTRSTEAMEAMEATEQKDGWTRAARSPWTVLCAVVAVVLGPAATTASALEQANKAPLHHAVRADQRQAYIPTDTTTRRRVAA